jgi:threonine dehydratase
MKEQLLLPDLKDIQAAQERIKNVAVKTPLLESPTLSHRFNRKVFLKLECFQPIRVFKIRGAYNKISHVKEDKVVALSSGNHGLAVAYSSRLLGKKATIVVPETAVKEKVNSIIEYGGEVVKVKTLSEREPTANRIVNDTGAAMVHPFNDPLMIAGNGTCGLEIMEQCPEADSVVVPIGGGGLISGISIAVKSIKPSANIYGVEPEGAPKMKEALRVGHPVNMDSKSIADGLIPPSVGDLTLECCKKYVNSIETVSDEEIISAMKTLIKEVHIFPEPSGAASTAFLETGVKKKLGENVVVVVSGGNVSLELLSKVLTQ